MALFGRPDFLVRADLLPGRDGSRGRAESTMRWSTPSWPGRLGPVARLEAGPAGTGDQREMLRDLD